jgi:hypothetical protein
MKNVLILIFSLLSSHVVAQEFDGICRIATNDKQWSGVLIEQGVLTVAHPDEQKCVAYFENDTEIIGVKIKLAKQNKIADIALYECAVPTYVKIKRHKLSKEGKSAKIIGYIGGNRVERNGGFLYNGTVDGYPIIGYSCEATSGMSGSPVFFGDVVTGIQFGGGPSSTDTVSYDTVINFLGQ